MDLKFERILPFKIHAIHRIAMQRPVIIKLQCRKGLKATAFDEVGFSLKHCVTIIFLFIALFEQKSDLKFDFSTPSFRWYWKLQ